MQYNKRSNDKMLRKVHFCYRNMEIIATYYIAGLAGIFHGEITTMYYYIHSVHFYDKTDKCASQNVDTIYGNIGICYINNNEY